MADLQHLFVYGTLIDPEVQQRIIGRLVEGTPDTLENVSKSEIKLGNNTYPILIEAQGQIVDGHILTVTSAELEQIDKYETDAYRRLRRQTKNGVDVWVYAK